MKYQSNIKYQIRLICLIGLISLILPGCATVPKATYPPTAISPALQDQIININGTKYVPLVVVCDRFDYKWSWDTVARKAGIQNKRLYPALSGGTSDNRKGGVYIRFMEGSDFAVVNNKVERMEAPAVLSQGALMIPASFAQARILPPHLRAPQPTVLRPKHRVAAPSGYLLRKVVIDPGHGGKDPGAIGRCGLKEKDIVLDIAGRLKRKLEQEGSEVFLTRYDDRFVGLTKRAQIANEQQADIFISIHANAARVKNAKGFEVYYLAEAADESAKLLAEQENASLEFEQSSFKVNSSGNLESILWDLVSTENRAESIQLANYICSQARRNLWVRQRGVKSAKFYVLKGARMPSILIEVGFITNRDEEEKLKEPSYRDSVAAAIAQGILDYREEYQVAEGFTN